MVKTNGAEGQPARTDAGQQIPNFNIGCCNTNFLPAGVSV